MGYLNRWGCKFNVSYSKGCLMIWRVRTTNKSRKTNEALFWFSCNILWYDWVNRHPILDAWSYCLPIHFFSKRGVFFPHTSWPQNLFETRHFSDWVTWHLYWAKRPEYHREFTRSLVLVRNWPMDFRCNCDGDISWNNSFHGAFRYRRLQGW